MWNVVARFICGPFLISLNLFTDLKLYGPRSSRPLWIVLLLLQNKRPMYCSLSADTWDTVNILLNVVIDGRSMLRVKSPTRQLRVSEIIGNYSGWSTRFELHHNRNHLSNRWRGCTGLPKTVSSRALVFLVSWRASSAASRQAHIHAWLPLLLSSLAGAVSWAWAGAYKN